jgi:UDP-2-acetamido-3-amino-2,3-dideoxy-glucuronate N-acetyltransferase
MITPAEDTVVGQRPRIGCIGGGYWGRNLIRNFAQLGVLHTVCDTRLDALAAFASLHGPVRTTPDYESVLADPEIDAVAIATPAESHSKIVRAALLAGKDVFVEKPLCLSPDDGEGIVRLAAETDRILMVGHLLHYHPAIQKIDMLVRKGELGRLQYIYSNRLNLGKIRREENILWSFAPHDISIILGLVKEMPSSVRAQGGYYLHDSIADVTTSLLSFPSGVKAHVFVSWLHPYKEQKLVIVGDRQMVVFDDMSRDRTLVLYPHRIDWREGLPMPSAAEGIVVQVPAIEPLRAELAHFIDCVRERRRPLTDGAEALRVLRVLDQCDRSLMMARRSAAPVRRHARRPLPEPAAQAEPQFTAHETAVIDEEVEIGSGTTIWHFTHVLKNSVVGKNCRFGQNVVVGPNVHVGDGVKIQNNVSVYEGVTLEDDVFCGPSMVFTNVINPRSAVARRDEFRPTLVKKGASLGANCTIVCGVTIGRYAFVGAGAVITKDVPDYALTVGNPARAIGWICECGVRLKQGADTEALACQDCGLQYVLINRQLRRAVRVSAPSLGS